MKRSLSKKEIKKTYEMILAYYDKYLKPHGVKMPRLNSTKGFTKDALILVYLAQGYPKTRKVSKGELTQFIHGFYPEVNDVQQARHLGAQKGWFIASGGRDNREVILGRGEYQLVSLEKCYPNFKGHRVKRGETRFPVRKPGKRREDNIYSRCSDKTKLSNGVKYRSSKHKSLMVREEGSSMDYKNRLYLSAIESAKYLNTSVKTIHNLAKGGLVKVETATSGQMRFDLRELKKYEHTLKIKPVKKEIDIKKINILDINGTTQKIFVKNSVKMDDLPDNSVHLMITSPPYFDTKMYSREPIENDLGNIHNVDEWFEKISEAWKEVYRVLQPGRKAFINIMNLPIRLENGRFRTLNLSGRTIDLCERIGFIFKRDIVWHKTNAVRAHFGTYPYPGGILINNMHEFILEFDKPEKKGFKKYGHLTKEQKEQSKIGKEFWLSIKKSDVWVMKPQGSGDRRNHVAPFPYELPFRLIKAFSYVGETVLDPFVGSGTTLNAAADLKRSGVGYEIVPEIACEMLKSLKNYQPKLF